MPEKKSYQSHIDATVKYNRTHTRRICCNLNLGTDADIVSRLESESNVQGYIKRLIREDIARSTEQPDS